MLRCWYPFIEFNNGFKIIQNPQNAFFDFSDAFVILSIYLLFIRVLDCSISIPNQMLIVALQSLNLSHNLYRGQASISHLSLH